MTESAIRLGLVLPDILGTYSDGGNAEVLRLRARWRGIAATITEIGYHEPVPSSLDLYLLGGGEDEAQALAAAQLRAHPGIQRAAARGAVVFGVCAGLQLLGADFTTSDGVRHRGLGLLDAVTSPGRQRAVGEVVVEVGAELGAEPLTGFENHLGRTRVGPGARPLGRVRAGTGNGDGTEGAVTGRVLATYLHGPVLARNPALADLLLGWVLGAPPAALPLPEVGRLREERLQAARRGARR
ncbi:glutamine amidotransferase [Amycolatopsis acidiphila]|uniref:Lipid II isoglutaminyl synthase (glutamine-hydrolyzing) subunit GatD n=1 Tax=Amycolatopsis acidiphila TaxID=715473 RepID=A0A558AJE0_9PSEU|nr:glutamine amidotransferase [Amycolatopsis acidiphila]TVT24321.1 glutamine amidotransferase [Amycolatopsis acidiphila]UIJ62545.1 glutamine amidotransferase [Amycolatopsis acidiphila]GHG85322.1 glutamine amidotransferase [Amycolatopsis acidiphila]